MSNQPDDYIDLMGVKAPKRRTLRKDIREIIRRFYGQEFTYTQIITLLREDPHYARHDALVESVRHYVWQLSREGKLTVVRLSTWGDHEASVIYNVIPNS